MTRTIMDAFTGLSRLSRRVGGFAADHRGVAAVEFAAILPFMLAIYIGGVEISQGVSADRKVTLVSRTVTDLAARATNIDNAGMTSILSASSKVVAPYDATQLVVTVSRVDIDANGNATIVWSDSLNGSKRAVGQSVTVPTGLNVKSTSLIWGEAQYSYTPTLGYVMTGTLTLKDQLYMAPRMSAVVTRCNC